MGPLYWVLRGHEPMPAEPPDAPDMDAWAAFFQNLDARRVAETKLPGFTVSTVFLAMGIKARLFETMIFAKDEEDDLHLAGWRCATWDEALDQHAAAVLVVKTRKGNRDE